LLHVAPVEPMNAAWKSTLSLLSDAMPVAFNAAPPVLSELLQPRPGPDGLLPHGQRMTPEVPGSHVIVPGAGGGGDCALDVLETTIVAHAAKTAASARRTWLLLIEILQRTGGVTPLVCGAMVVRVSRRSGHESANFSSRADDFLKYTRPRATPA